ncbi:MAG: mismatch-specific DNA-glycosylase [Acidimicrobiaceae bacterium]|nr:mismatch-specific DNA-glycosylase [Acidimicrobiaceae bacterium]
MTSFRPAGERQTPWETGISGLEPYLWRGLSYGGGIDAEIIARSATFHLSVSRLPLALADLHRSLAVGTPLVATLPGGGVPFRDLMLGDPPPFGDLVVGAGFDLDHLEVRRARKGACRCIIVHARRARSLPDTVGPGMRVLVCGLNPSIYAADAGIPFARPGNRFWPAAVAAGLVDKARDADAALADRGLGMTDLVKRASRSASELRPIEYREGAARVERLVAWLRPAVLCVVGLAGWRTAVDQHATAGPQPSTLAGVPVYLVPSSSGRNAHVSFDDLVARLQAVRALAAS